MPHTHSHTHKSSTNQKLRTNPATCFAGGSREQLFQVENFEFFSKAIFDLKHYFLHFLTEDIYIFSFLTFIVKKILA